jgi:hypothetical protein
MINLPFDEVKEPKRGRLSPEPKLLNFSGSLQARKINVAVRNAG